MRILCATDLHPKSESALDRAGMLAKRLRAELTIMHVVSYAESAAMFEEEADRASARLISRTKPPSWVHGDPPSILIRCGHPARTLVETARDLEPGLVILGTPGRRSAWDALTGSLAERLVRTLDCPVLLVRRMPFGPYREALIAVDWSAQSAEPIRVAEKVVLTPAARAAVVHTCKPGRTKEVRERLAALLESASENVGRYRIVVEHHPSVVGALSITVRRLSPDLLVLGTRRRGRLERTLFGSTASRMLMTRGADVLVVPHRRRSQAPKPQTDALVGELRCGRSRSKQGDQRREPHYEDG